MKQPASITIESLTYPVHLGIDLRQEIDEFIRPYLESGGLYILTDNNTCQYCFPFLKECIPYLAGQAFFSINPGEQSKDLTGLAGIWSWLTENRAGRNSLLINLGGGVVSDLGGFAAATYNRGMAYINIPTSLTGQVDASVGGKTAINVSGIKNQAGLFYNPAAVFIMPVFLETLPEDHFKSGYAEIIKCAALSGYQSWELMKTESLSDHKHILDIIHHTVDYKCRLVADDPFDNATRKMLNFGHTIGHALESFFNRPDGHELLHGQAIAIGMICEAHLSNKLAGMSMEELEEISSVINSLFDLQVIEVDHFDQLAEIINYDKKKSGNGIGFSLLRGFGKHSPGIVVNDTEIIHSFEYYNRIIQQ